MSGVTIHESLTVDDLFRASNLIAAVLDELDGDTLASMRSGRADKNELGRTLITVALRVAPESGKTFLAGLVDKTPDEFGALPMDATLDIVEQLVEREDIRGFFERARGLAGRFETGKAEVKPVKSSGG